VGRSSKKAIKYKTSKVTYSDTQAAKTTFKVFELEHGYKTSAHGACKALSGPLPKARSPLHAWCLEGQLLPSGQGWIEQLHFQWPCGWSTGCRLGATRSRQRRSSGADRQDREGEVQDQLTARID